MKKWLGLLIFFCCWITAGLAFSLYAGDAYQYHRPEKNARLTRIVSTAPNLTEILFALGLDDRIVAVSSGSDYPLQAKERKKIGSFWQPDIEAVISAGPDLVVTLGFTRQKNLARRLQRVGYKTISVNIEKVSELYSAIKKIGSATGKKDKALELVEQIRNELNTLSQRLKGPRPKVLYVVQREPLRVAGLNTFVNEIIELAGGQNAIGSTIQMYPPIGAEQIIACKAQVIIEPVMAGGSLVEQKNNALKYWNKFPSLPAVKKDRIYAIDADIVSRLSPRLPQAVKTMAGCIRIELFENSENERAFNSKEVKN